MIRRSWRPRDGAPPLSDEHPYYLPDELELAEEEVPEPEPDQTMEERVSGIEAVMAALAGM